MKLFIKNMVCPRCILVVRDILRQAGIEASSVVLGEAVLPAELTAERRKELDEALRAVGFELIDDRRKQTVERVKNTVIELVRRRTPLCEPTSRIISRTGCMKITGQ